MTCIHKPVIAPSILAGNHARLAESLVEIVASGAPWVHLDIMDGHFVPNLTFGPETVRSLRKEAPSPLIFDVHLMLENPQKYIDAFADAGADYISIHVEPEHLPIKETLAKIRERGCRNGIVLNPPTSVDTVRPFLHEVDLVLVMTVQPGFGGQSFQEGCLEKIRRLDQWRKNSNYSFRLEVDGGVDEKTGIRCRLAGADTLVAGSAFFRTADRHSFNQCLTASLT